VLGICQALLFGALVSNYCCGHFTFLSRRLGAVEDLYELCTYGMWTGNRSTLYEADCRYEFFWLCLCELQSNACVVCLSRLETRTKESNMYASHWE
jgi:hypothetical protein